MKKKILVSGSNGQLAAELTRFSKFFPMHEFVFRNKSELDLSSPDSIRQNLEIDYEYFINTGAFTGVDKAEEQKSLAYKINAEALSHIAEFASNKTRIIHISSDYVYHSVVGRPLVETDPTRPQGVYAKSKLEGEQNLLSKRPDSIVIRSSWIYSSYGHNFLKTMLRLGETKDRLAIVSDQTGAPTYAADLADAILKIINHPDKASGIYNYSNKGYTNWAGFAEAIFKLTGKKCRIDRISTKEYNAPAPRPEWSVLSKMKALKTFDFEIPEWEKSLKKCLRELGYEL